MADREFIGYQWLHFCTSRRAISWFDSARITGLQPPMDDGSICSIARGGKKYDTNLWTRALVWPTTGTHRLPASRKRQTTSSR